MQGPDTAAVAAARAVEPEGPAASEDDHGDLPQLPRLLPAHHPRQGVQHNQ